MERENKPQIIYVAHPLRGAFHTREIVEENQKSIQQICRDIADTFPDTLILSPIHAFSFIDALDTDRADWVLEQCRRLLALADELWVFGDWGYSEGCQMEIRCACALGKTIRFPRRTKKPDFDAIDFCKEIAQPS